MARPDTVCDVVAARLPVIGFHEAPASAETLVAKRYEYPVMVESNGFDHISVAEPSPGVALSPVGATG